MSYECTNGKGIRAFVANQSRVIILTKNHIAHGLNRG